MFYQNHSLSSHAVEILCNLNLRNHWTWTLKIKVSFWAHVNFVIFWTWTRKIHERLDSTRIDFRIYLN